jgi:Rps23 Pro-64 3,4-dihydroxylase Tpa1-like proline 4-hydroxylase
MVRHCCLIKITFPGSDRNDHEQKNMESKFEELIGSFGEGQVGLSEHFLSQDLACALQQNLLNLDSADRLKAAGIGNQLLKDPGQDKRGDKIFWIEKDTLNVHERKFLAQVEAFIVYLNNTCYTGINAYEFHYALYETGSSYRRHLDQFKNNSDRKYSLISYLNTDWQESDGGELLIYQSESIEKVIPTMQKAIFFKSDALEHEVRISSRPRMSITGWLKSS